jgi:hypothetical protein
MAGVFQQIEADHEKYHNTRWSKWERKHLKLS